MVYIEPKNPVTPEQMESGVLYFLAQAVLVPVRWRPLVPTLPRENASRETPQPFVPQCRVRGQGKEFKNETDTPKDG